MTFTLQGLQNTAIAADATLALNVLNDLKPVVQLFQTSNALSFPEQQIALNATITDGLNQLLTALQTTLAAVPASLRPSANAIVESMIVLGNTVQQDFQVLATLATDQTGVAVAELTAIDLNIGEVIRGLLGALVAFVQSSDQQLQANSAIVIAATQVHVGVTLVIVEKLMPGTAAVVVTLTGKASAIVFEIQNMLALLLNAVEQNLKAAGPILAGDTTVQGPSIEAMLNGLQTQLGATAVSLSGVVQDDSTIPVSIVDILSTSIATVDRSARSALMSVLPSLQQLLQATAAQSTDLLQAAQSAMTDAMSTIRDIINGLSAAGGPTLAVQLAQVLDALNNIEPYAKELLQPLNSPLTVDDVPVLDIVAVTLGFAVDALISAAADVGDDFVKAAANPALIGVFAGLLVTVAVVVDVIAFAVLGVSQVVIAVGGTVAPDLSIGGTALATATAGSTVVIGKIAGILAAPTAVSIGDVVAALRLVATLLQNALALAAKDLQTIR